MTHDGSWTRLCMLAAALTSCLAGGRALAAAASVKQAMTATTKAPDAKGRLRLVLRTASNGKFQVLARRLRPNAAFDVVVKGVKVGSIATNGGGSGKARFSSRPRGADSFLGFDPRGGQVIVRDDEGDDDLVGDVPDDSDGNAGACCIAEHDDDGDTECEDMAAADCMAAGGTPGTSASCLPDPCENGPEPAEIVCCIAESSHGAFIDEDPEVECEETSEAECAQKGGMAVSAHSCDPNPCAATPPGDQIACCVSEEEEIECEVLTSENCTAHHGAATSATSCETDPCGTGDGGGGDD